MSDDLSALHQFKGTARLFPLPNLVLFPHAVQPLHIFEPRYRQMTRDALADDRLIALVLLQSGWEADYEGRPLIHPVACLGNILAEQPLADGRYNLLLRGLSRVRILSEIEGNTLYRVARAELLAEEHVPAELVQPQRRRLAERTLRWFAGQANVAAEFVKLFQSGLDLSALCDILSFALPMDVELKQAMLGTTDVAERVRALLRYLDCHKPPAAVEAVPTAGKFPPDFSEN